MKKQINTLEKKPIFAILVNSLAGGGAEKIALISLSELKQKGFRVILICLEKEKGYTVPAEIPLIYLTNFNKLQNPFIKIFWVCVSAYRLSKYIRRYNIGFIQSHLVRSNFINAASKLFGSNHHAQIVSHLPINFAGSSFIVGFLKSAIYRWFYKKADEIISISQRMKSEIEKTMQLSHYGVDHRVIYNPHDLGVIRELAREEPSQFTFSAGKRYILIAGRLVRHKRADDTINALTAVREKFPNVELIILGEGKDRRFFEEVTKKRGLDSCVHFLGRRANPFPFIARSELLVLSSELEGLPNIIIESLTCGTPVISSDCVSGPREILHPDSDFSKQIISQIDFAPYGVLYPVGQVDLLAEGIMSLLSNSRLRERYIQRGKKYVEKFDKRKIVEEYIHFRYPTNKDKVLSIQNPLAL